MIALDLDIAGIILLSGLVACFLLQMLYYWLLNRPLCYQKKIERGGIEVPSSKPSVSVVIYAKNEFRNLHRFLPLILEQDYPLYEVIVVNDGLSDDSNEVLAGLREQYDHLYCTYIPEESRYLSRKKLAMMVGVKAAKNDVLLFTEPDCEPAGKDWISLMVRHLEQNKTVVLGLNVLSQSTGILTKYAAYDVLFKGLQMLSLATLNRPYSGSGRNMAYRKELFYEQKGYSRFMNLQAGEDDLFINQVATTGNTRVEVGAESLTITHMEDFYAWKELKLSKMTTQQYYKPGPLFFWRAEPCLRYLFIGLVIASIIYGLPNLLLPITAGVLFLLRFSFLFFVINRTTRKLRLEKFYFTLPLFDLLQPLIDSYFYIYHIFRSKNDYTWR